MERFTKRQGAERAIIEALEENMGARLEFCGNVFEIQDFFHSIEDEAMGNPYNSTFHIHIISGSFSGFSGGCECDYKELKKFIEQLNDLINFRTDKVVFQEIGYGSTIEFEGDGLGHITVSGIIYGEGMRHTLEFELMTDQTAYPPFINALKEL